MSRAWYESFDVKRLWQAVSSAKKDEPTNRDQAQAWRLAAGALDAHRDELTRLRGELVAQWPPESNAAAGAYLKHLDRLLEAVSETARASETNGRQLDNVTDAIGITHGALKPVYDKYVANEKKLAEYDSGKAKLTAVAAIAAASAVAPGTVPAVIGAANSLSGPPVPDGAQEALNRQARNLMKPLTQAAEEANLKIKPPPEYIPPRPADTPGTDIRDSYGDGGATPLPPIAPPAYHAAGPDGLPALGGADGSSWQGGSGALGGSDPELAGVVPLDPAPPGARHPGGSPPGGGFPPGGGGGAPPGQGPGLPPGRVIAPTPIGSPSGLAPSGSRGSAGSISAPGGRGAAQPGRVIGAPPAAGGSPAGGGQRGAGGVGPGVPGRSGGAREGAQGGRAWDRDNPWAVATGVPPVIEPPAEPDFEDPGPGIIGIDR